MYDRYPPLLVAALLLLVGVSDLQAQVMDELLGNWGGRVRSRTEVILDPADSRRSQGPVTRNDQFWVLSFQDTGGQMEGWQRYTEWARKSLVMTRDAYGYPFRVTEIDGKEFTVEWSQGLFECEVDLELKDDDTKLEGRFTCRRGSTNRNVFETVTRGDLELERYQTEGTGGGR